MNPRKTVEVLSGLTFTAANLSYYGEPTEAVKLVLTYPGYDIGIAFTVTAEGVKPAGTPVGRLFEGDDALPEVQAAMVHSMTTVVKHGAILQQLVADLVDA